MGQEQSFNSKTRDLLQDGTTKHPTHRRTLSDQRWAGKDVSPMINRIHSAIDIRHDLPSDDQERSRASSEQGNEEEGIIYVSNSSTDHQDPILTRLQQLEPVRPLIKDTDRSSFGLESLFDLGTAGMKVLSGKESISSVSRPSSIKTNGTDTIVSARTDPLVDILLTLQSHINTNMARINLNQKRLLQRSKHVDDLSLKANQAISLALTQSRIASDRLNEAKHIKNHAKQTRHYATAIFESLSRIQHLLDPEDRVDHAEFERRWPVLHTLHQRASNKSRRPPAFLPSSTSSSSTNIKHDTAQQQPQQKTSTATATINLATITPLSSSETSTAPTYLIPPSTSSSEIVDQQEPQQQNGNSSTLAMDRLRSLIGDSTLPDTTTTTTTTDTAIGTMDDL